MNKFWEGEELAVIAFWDKIDGGNYSCSRHFYVPNPKKRVVREVAGKELYEVLYLSKHCNDIFFFFEGPEITPET